MTNVVLVIVIGLMGSLKVSRNWGVRPGRLALLPTELATTVGAVVSLAVPVVNAKLPGLVSELPAVSRSSLVSVTV